MLRVKTCSVNTNTAQCGNDVPCEGYDDLCDGYDVLCDGCDLFCEGCKERTALH